MTIARPDVVLFAVGLVLVAGSAYGLYVLDGDGPAGIYSIDWSAHGHEHPEHASDFREAETATFEFPVAETNLANVGVKVSCSEATPAGAAAPATVNVRVEGPDGLSGERSGTCGSDLQVLVEVQSAPTQTTAAGSSESAAAESLREGGSTTGQGAWTVRIDTTRPGGLLGGTPAAASGTATPYVELWQPTLTLTPK